MVYEKALLLIQFQEQHCHQGEWSIGSVLDCYWHFGSVGDHYLGRIVAGFDPNKDSFDCLPPHWTIIDPLSNENVKEGMTLIFGVLMDEAPYFIPVLLNVFASMVYLNRANCKGPRLFCIIPSYYKH